MRDEGMNDRVWMDDSRVRMDEICPNHGNCPLFLPIFPLFAPNFPLFLQIFPLLSARHCPPVRVFPAGVGERVALACVSS